MKTHTMRNFLLLLLSSLTVACSPRSYQLVTLQSEQVPLRADKLIFENDTMALRYDFYGENGSVRFFIYNKLEVPLYVDWKKSSFIVGKQKFDYWVDEAVLQASSRGTEIDWTSWLSTQRSSLSGRLTKEERIAFIPPKTEIENVKFVAKPGEQFPTWLLNRSRDIKHEEAEKKWAAHPSKSRTAITRYQFELDNSPLRFRNYLTFSTDERFEKEFHYDNTFWVSEVQTLDARQLVGYQFFRDYLNPARPYPKGMHAYRSANRFFLKVGLE